VRRVCLIAADHAAPPLQAMIDAAREGAEAAGGSLVLWDGGAPDADAYLVAAPIVLYGLPGALKARIETWLDLLARGTLIARTGGNAAGYLATYAPDDTSILDAFDEQVRGMFASFGMEHRAPAAGFAAPGAPLPRDETQVVVARRLGQVLAENDGFAGWPREYLNGIELFCDGEFWLAHEAWEDLWIREGTDLKLFYQGLIQVAAAFHQHGHEKWAGVDKLLRKGTEKLRAFRPFAQGLDVDAFLLQLDPWLDVAAARVGRAPPVTRVPDAPPRIELETR